MYMGHDENRTRNEIYLLDNNRKSKTKCSEGRVICLYSLCYFIESTSLLRKVATAEYVPGKRLLLNKACIVTFMPRPWFAYPRDYIDN